MKNSKNIFSLGDCSTVQFKKFSEYVVALLDRFEIADGAEITSEQFRGMSTIPYDENVISYTLFVSTLKHQRKHYFHI